MNGAAPTPPRGRTYELPGAEVVVRAAPEICFQVVASAGRVIERYPDGTRLVGFEAGVGRRRVRTRELVHPHEPDRIDYHWVEGPLPFVEETIEVEPAGDGEATLRYRGRFALDAPWPARAIMRHWVARRFSRAVHEHMLEAKEIAERRAARSRLYPRR